LTARNDDELLTVAEVAAELKVTEATVRRWINQDSLPARRLGGKEFRVVRRDLDAFQGIEPAPPAPAQRSTRMVTGMADRMSVK
jgi:excisionase family DNA binding protein